MNNKFIKLLVFSVYFFSPTTIFAVEVTGAGSTLPAPLMKVWSDSYSLRFPSSVIKYQSSSPIDGIKRLVSNEIDFSIIDMPLSKVNLEKNGLIQLPLVLGGVTPIVNLPDVFPGQLRLDGITLGEIFLGNIKQWNDPAIVALNRNMHLPNEKIIIVHRVSPPGIRTLIGDYIAKTHPRWKAIKGDGDMSGVWPATAIEVKDPAENIATIKKTPYSIGYGPIQQVLKNGLIYVKLKNKAGNFVSPDSENISAAASNALWDNSNGFDVVLTYQEGANSWPMSNASFVLMRKVSSHPERSKEVVKYFKYCLKPAGLQAVLQTSFISLPRTVKSITQTSWNSIVDEKGVSVAKD